MMLRNRFAMIGVLAGMLATSYGFSEESTILFVSSVEQAHPDAKDIARAKELLEASREIEIKQDIKPPPFHKRPHVQIKNTEQVYCTACHLPVPHSKSLRTRAFMNMHTQYIACETCHFRPENVSLDYRWFEYDSVAEASKQPGRLHSGRNKKDPTPLLARDGKVKIAPFYQGQPALITRSHSFTKELEQRMKNADLDEQAKIHAQIHKPLQTKGTECANCHTVDEDLLNLVQLSDSPAQAEAIQRNTIADFFKHYKPEKPLAPGELPPPEQRIKITDLLN